jgi:hypothetical protein
MGGISTGALQLIVGFIIGIAPTIYNYIKDRTRWKAESGVIRSQEGLNQSIAIENIASAAGQLLDQSQRLSEKNSALVDSYEKALERQTAMLDERITEFEKKEQQYKIEIHELRVQIDLITDNMKRCSSDIITIISELQRGELTAEKLAIFQEKWK